MFPSHLPEQRAIASQLVEELAAYEDDLRGLVERRWDPELAGGLSARFDRMQMYAGALPSVSQSWTELLISRVELVHALWSVSSPSRIGGKVRTSYAQHQLRIAELRRQCQQGLAGAQPQA
jgi:hypothetical protein